MNSFSRWLGVMVSVLSLLACTVLKPLTVDPAQLRSTLKQGDRVEITTTSGQRHQLTVEEVNDQGLSGSGQSVTYADIQGIARKETAAGRTALVVLGIVAVGAAAAGGGGGDDDGGGGGY